MSKDHLVPHQCWGRISFVCAWAVILLQKQLQTFYRLLYQPFLVLVIFLSFKPQSRAYFLYYSRIRSKKNPNTQACKKSTLLFTIWCYIHWHPCILPTVRHYGKTVFPERIVTHCSGMASYVVWKSWSVDGYFRIDPPKVRRIMQRR